MHGDFFIAASLIRSVARPFRSASFFIENSLPRIFVWSQTMQQRSWVRSKSSKGAVISTAAQRSERSGPSHKTRGSSDGSYLVTSDRNPLWVALRNGGIHSTPSQARSLGMTTLFLVRRCMVRRVTDNCHSKSLPCQGEVPPKGAEGLNCGGVRERQPLPKNSIHIPTEWM